MSWDGFHDRALERAVNPVYCGYNHASTPLSAFGKLTFQHLLEGAGTILFFFFFFY